MNKSANTRKISNNAIRVANSISSSGKSVLGSSTESGAAALDTSYLDQIRVRIKNNLSKNLQIYLMVAIPIIIFIIYLGFKFNFNARTINALGNMQYKKEIALSNLEPCSNIDKSMQYKLCDYYISSSFMTPCVGNQHYDYVSLEMITEVIQSGARYIQIPICESDVGLNAVPIVATAQYGQKLVTSLNTLDVRDVLKSIRANAFNINNTNLNYPIIIHLILNTRNPYTLGVLADSIQEVLSDKLCNVSMYTEFPIYLEKLCKLLGQIIIIATPEYIGTKLENYIVPITNLFESYHYADLANINNPSGSLLTSSYNLKLSETQQHRSNVVFKTKYSSLDYIINNSSSVGKQILNDRELLNNLVNFNKIGMTLIKPSKPADVLSSNYDPTEAVFNGCQFISMNFQINDDNMKNYLKIFKNGSFVLKPASMRFTEQEESTPDLVKVYKTISPTSSRVINQLYYEYNNLLIAFESYSMPGNYLTQIESNLQFNQGSLITRDKFDNKTYNIGINQCFLVGKSTVSMGTSDIPMFISSPPYSSTLSASSVIGTNAYGNHLVTQTGNRFNLEKKQIKKTDLYQQSFVFEQSDIKDSDDETLYLMRTIALQNPMYLANQNKSPTTYAYTSTPEGQNNMTFIIHIVPFTIQLRILTLYSGTIKTMTGGIVGVLENNITDGTSYILEAAFTPTQSGGNNFNYLSDQFFIRNSKPGNKNGYLSYNPDTGFIHDNPGKPSSNGIFNLKFNNGFYSLVNTEGRQMILYDNNLVKFVSESTIKSNENLFKIDVNYVLA
jgi:hypothetical protein